MKEEDCMSSNIMYNKVIEESSLDDAWIKWWYTLKEIKRNGDKVLNSRDGDVVAEVINATTVISNPRNNIMKNEVRNLSIRYAIGEMLWYMSGNRDLKEIQKYTNNWDRMSDDGKVVNSNYGWCIKEKFGFDQWEYVKGLLKEDNNTRQAVIHIKDADNSYSKDVNCTVYLNFLIREGKLHMLTHMRSNDIWLGFPYDIFQFTNMQILMSMELGIPIGKYTHVVDSLHLYERDSK